MAEQKVSSTLAAPLHMAASAVRKVPGTGAVGRAGQEVLDRIGAVSPRGRRLAVYTGAGVLGVAGVVEWPVALTGAAVAWLTQPRPEGSEHTMETGAASGTAAEASVPAPEAGSEQAGSEQAGSERSLKGAGLSAAAKKRAAPAGRGGESPATGAAGGSDAVVTRPGRTTR